MQLALLAALQAKHQQVEFAILQQLEHILLHKICGQHSNLVMAVANHHTCGPAGTIPRLPANSRIQANHTSGRQCQPPTSPKILKSKTSITSLPCSFVLEKRSCCNLVSGSMIPSSCNRQGPLELHTLTVTVALK